MLTFIPLIIFLFLLGHEIIEVLKTYLKTNPNFWLNKLPWDENVPLTLSLMFFLLFLVLSVIYALCTYLPRLTPFLFGISKFLERLSSIFGHLHKFFIKPIGNLAQNLYPARRLFEKNIRYFLWGIVFFLVIGILPYIDEWLINLGKTENASTTSPFYAAVKTSWALLASLVAGILGALPAIMAFFKTAKSKNGKSAQSGVIILGSLVFLFGVLLFCYHLAEALKYFEIYFYNNPSNYGIACDVYMIFLYLSVALGFLTNLNYISVHRFYRDRLMETFIPDPKNIFLENWSANLPSEEANITPLSKMYPKPDNNQEHSNDENSSKEPTKHPYHIINTNVVLVDSNIPKFRGRGGDNFILSPFVCGSNSTGWVRTHEYMNNELTLPTAMSISGAAVNPNTGVGGEGATRNRWLSLVMELLNLRLGYWAQHPRRDTLSFIHFQPNFFFPFLFNPGNQKDSIFTLKRFAFINWERFKLKYFLGWFFSRMNENKPFLQLSDGGHFENLGIYELLRRKTRVIIVCDAGADKDFKFEDLGNALEKARVDFGVKVKDLNLKPLIPPSEEGEAEVGFALAKIIYNEEEEKEEEKEEEDIGRLIYIKTTFIKDIESKDVLAYKRSHKDFPDQSTADQFFDEKQFEAYRELGYQIALTMVQGIKDTKDPIYIEAFGKEWM